MENTTGKNVTLDILCLCAGSAWAYNIYITAFAVGVKASSQQM